MGNVITISKVKSEWEYIDFKPTFGYVKNGCYIFSGKMKNYESGNQWYPKLSKNIR